MPTRTSTLAEVVGANVAALRAERGWTQATLAEAVGMDARSISRIEHGSASPSLRRLESLADVFGVSVEALVRNDAQPNPPKAAPAELERVWRKIPRSRRRLALDVLRAFARK